MIKVVLGGRARPADGAVWPLHWAYDPMAPRFEFDPTPLAGLRFQCIFVEQSHERLALVLQQQLQAIGISLDLEQLPLDEANARLASGDFDAVLADVANGPMVRPYWFWHSRGHYNFGKFKSTKVDAALDHIRSAPDEAAYKKAVSAFQRAIVEDPPGIFLVWSERARAVTTRFQVLAEPGRDILSTLRLWRPATDNQMGRPN